MGDYTRLGFDSSQALRTTEVAYNGDSFVMLTLMGFTPLEPPAGLPPLHPEVTARECLGLPLCNPRISHCTAIGSYSKRSCRFRSPIIYFVQLAIRQAEYKNRIAPPANQLHHHPTSIRQLHGISSRHSVVRACSDARKKRFLHFRSPESFNQRFTTVLVPSSERENVINQSEERRWPSTF